MCCVEKFLATHKKLAASAKRVLDAAEIQLCDVPTVLHLSMENLVF